MAPPISEVVWPLRQGGAVSCAEPPSRSHALQEGTERARSSLRRAFPGLWRAALTSVPALSEFSSPVGCSEAGTPPGPVPLGEPLPRPGQLEGVDGVRKGT